MTYLFPTPSISDFQGLLTYLETIAPVGELIALVIFSVSFLSLKDYTTGRALPSAMFITAIVVIFEYLLGILHEAYFYAAIVALAATVVSLFFMQEQNV